MGLEPQPPGTPDLTARMSNSAAIAAKPLIGLVVRLGLRRQWGYRPAQRHLQGQLLAMVARSCTVDQARAMRPCALLPSPCSSPPAVSACTVWLR